MGKHYSQEDYQEIPLKNVVVEQLGTDPTTPADGRLWLNTVAGKIKARLAGVTRILVDDGDSRLSDSRPPNGTAGGSLAGTYPNPTFAANTVGTAEVGASIIETGVVVGGATGTATAAQGALRKLGTGANDAAAGNDARLADARTPTGTASGDLTGTYPGPTIGANKVLLTHLALALIQSGLSSGTAATTAAALRALGFTANDAMPGNARLDQIAVPTTTVSMNSQRIINQADPVNPQDSATKNYVDALVQGLDVKASVSAATTANIATLAGGAPLVVDGVTLAAGARVLVKNQTTASANGIYTVTTAGTGANGTWARATDMDIAGEVPGAFVFVEGGTTQINTGWVANVTLPFTLGASNMPWAQFSGAGTYIAGAGLALTGSTFDVNVDNSSIEIAADILRVKSLGITNAMLAGGIDLTSKVTGALPIANGGTGATNASNARAALGTVTGEIRTVNAALTAGTYSSGFSFSNITTFFSVEVRDIATTEVVDIDHKLLGSPGAQFVALRSDVAVLANTLAIYAVGY